MTRSYGDSIDPFVKGGQIGQKDVFVRVSSLANIILLSASVCLMVAALSLVFEIAFVHITGMHLLITAALLSLVGGIVLCVAGSKVFKMMSNVIPNSSKVKQEFLLLKPKVIQCIYDKISQINAMGITFPSVDREVFRPLIVSQNSEDIHSQQSFLPEATRTLLQEFVVGGKGAVDMDLFMEVCTQILLRGKFIKYKETIQFLSDEEKLSLAFPYYASTRIKDLEITDYKCQKLLVLLETAVTSSKSKSHPSVLLYSRLLFDKRFSKELFFVLLGVFSISDLKKICKETKKRYSDSESCLLLYVDLVKQFPKLIAAEAMFLNWLKRVCPYMYSHYCFNQYQRYFCRSLLKIDRFLKEDALVHFLENFSGVIPASIVLFHKGAGENFCQQGWSWDCFCEKAMEYATLTSLVPEYSGNIEKFYAYVNDGDKVLEGLSSLWLGYGRKLNFVDHYQKVLWDVKDLCLNDPVLKEKIREGLAFLKEMDLIGGYFIALIHLEITVLGLDLED